MKAVISGIHGFLGSHLKERLEKDGYEVFGISQEVLFNPIELRKFFEYHQPTLIVHLAAYGNIQSASLNNRLHPSKIIHANIMGTFNMLRESSNINYTAFVNTGTSSEYGKKDHPMSEEDVLVPETFYAASKASATHLCQAFALQYKKPIVTVRPFSVYGPGEMNPHFIPVLINNILHGKLTGVELKAMHDWIYIEDVIDGIMFVTKHVKYFPQRVVNIGTGYSTSNETIVEFLKNISGKDPLIAPVEGLREQDSLKWVANMNLMKSLQWEPKMRIDEGLQKTWESYAQ